MSYHAFKDDAHKLDYTLLPLHDLADVVRVLEFGARKYQRDSWRNVQDGLMRYLAAALRHIAAYQRGEANDPESGLPHLAHAACSLMFAQALPDSTPLAEVTLCGVAKEELFEQPVGVGQISASAIVDAESLKAYYSSLEMRRHL